MKNTSSVRGVLGLAGAFATIFVAFAPAASSQEEFVARRLFVSSPIFANNIIEFELDGTPVGLLVAPPALPQPSGLAFGPGGELFVKTAGPATAVVSLDAQGLPAGPPISSGGMTAAAGGLAFGPSGRLYAADVLAGTIQVFDPAGSLKDVITAPGLTSPFGIAFGPTGDVFVTNTGSQAIFQFDSSGTLLRELSAVGLKSASAIAVGPDESLYISAFNIDFVYVLRPDGTLDHAFTAPGLDGPSGLAFGPNGLLYVAAFLVNRIFVFEEDGTPQFDFDTIAPPQMIAFSPLRVGAKIKGTVASLVADPEKRSESFKGGSGPVFSLFPGLGVAMLLLEDDLADAADLASRLGVDRFVLPGRFTPAGEKAAVFSASQIPAFGGPAGLLELSIRGSTDSTTGAFVPKKGKGSWSARSGDVHFQGQIQTGKPLQ